VGYEWDRIFNNGATPPGLQVLSESHTVDDYKRADVSDTTYYVARSGAVVFATGSIYWTAALDNYRFSLDKSCSNAHPEVPSMQELMAHVMEALATHRLSAQVAYT